MITWHMPAPHPANISLNTFKPFLQKPMRDMITKEPNTDRGIPRRVAGRLFLADVKRVYKKYLPIFGKVVAEEVIGG